ncbi:(d)CMP kinase [Candidatus Latescibacterota bacterium]
MTMRKPIIAIDGPVGSGKTTTAKRVAETLKYIYVDTGAMYRAFTLDVLNNGVDPTEEKSVEKVVLKSKITLHFTLQGHRIMLNGTDVTERIRDRDVTKAVSSVSAMKCVRDLATELQRKFGQNGGVVMEGRDIGTVVFPHAEFKIYLDASIDIRVKRRFNELIAKGIDIKLEDLRQEIIERDRANIERELAPLKKAHDAVVFDTSDMTLDEQVVAIVSHVRKAEKKHQKRSNIGFIYRICQYFVLLNAKILFRLSVKGIEHIPKEGGFIVASNHASFLDPPLIGSIVPREMSFLAKKELFPVPIANIFLLVSKSIAIDRQGFSRQALKEMIQKLKEGRGLMLFPEGTRTKTGELGKPKLGVGMCTIMADVPVVPCYIEGSFRAKPFLTKITIHFLPIFSPKEIEAPTKKIHYLLVSKRIMYDIGKLHKKQMALKEKAKYNS